MKAVIFFSGLAGLLIFGPPFLKTRTHRHDISITVHQPSPAQVSWGGQEDCRFGAERRLTSSAAGVESLRLRAGSGSLEVVGVEGLGEIQAVARACASQEEFLDDLQMTWDMVGSTMVVETHYPEWSGWSGGDRYARLDLRVEVPAGLAAEIQDGSGGMKVARLGALEIQDGSGEILASDIRGDLVIQDGSGEVEIRGVSGQVKIQDGSGEIILEDAGSNVEIMDSSGELGLHGIGGSVTLHDSSGEIDVRGVVGSVRVIQDGSGGIAVSDVGGDFIVERDGSGEIHHQGVEGTVDIPRKRRDR